jgi:hypothetical protein
MAKWADRSNNFQGTFSQFAAGQGLSMGQISATQKKYGLPDNPGGGSGEPGIGPRGRGELRVGYGGLPAHVGNGTEQDPSNWGITGDPNVLVNWYVGPPPNQTIPGAVFYGTNPGGYTATPLANYRFEWDPKKIVIPVQREFHSYDLERFGNAIYYGASAYAIAGLAGIGASEALAGTPLANMPPPDLGPYTPIWDPYAYARFIFQMIAGNRGPPVPPRLPPPPPPYIGGP